MSRIRWIVFIFFLYSYDSILYAQPWFKQDQDHVILNVDLFVTSTCSHCHDVTRFLRQYQSCSSSTSPILSCQQDPDGLYLQRYVIDQDKKALEKLNNMLRIGSYTEAGFAVPAVFFCNSRWVGFDTPQYMGKTLLDAMALCRNAIKRDGVLPDSVVNTLRQQAFADLNWNRFNVGEPGVLKVIGLGLLDAIAPCSLFGLVCILALWILQQKTIRSAGLLTALIYVLIHMMYQTVPLRYYQILPYVFWLGLPIGVVMTAASLGTLLSDNRLKKIGKDRFRWVRILQSDRVLLCFGLIFIGLVSWYSQNCSMNLSLIFPAALAHTSANAAESMMLYGAYYMAYCTVPGLLWWMMVFFKFNILKNERMIFASRCFVLFTSALLTLGGYSLNNWTVSVAAVLTVLILALAYRPRNE